MPRYSVSRSIGIEAPLEKVRDVVADYHQWPTWSPWLCCEPDTSLNYHGTPGEIGHGYDWDGNVIGAGKLQIVEKDDQRLKMDLTFLKPFKSQADVTFKFRAIGDAQTEVTWQLDSKLPFFMFFMVKFMKNMIGMDYERGLRMLKEYVETGHVQSNCQLVGIVDVPESNYVGVKESCGVDQMEDSMGKTIPAAAAVAKDNGLEICGPPGAIYHKFDIKNQHCEYSAVMQVKSPAEIAGAVSGKLGGCKALKVIHTGSYRHLGNGWAMVMAHQRAQKLKCPKGGDQVPFELYLNDPCETDEADLVTEIFVPVRG